MKTYTVDVPFTGVITLSIQADSPEEAAAKAKKANISFSVTADYHSGGSGPEFGDPIILED